MRLVLILTFCAWTTALAQHDSGRLYVGALRGVVAGAQAYGNPTTWGIRAGERWALPRHGVAALSAVGAAELGETVCSNPTNPGGLDITSCRPRFRALGFLAEAGLDRTTGPVALTLAPGAGLLFMRGPSGPEQFLPERASERSAFTAALTAEVLFRRLETPIGISLGVLHAFAGPAGALSIPFAGAGIVF